MDKKIELVKEWHKKNKITTNGNSLTQTAKLGEEFGELCGAIVRGNTSIIKDSLGDMLVVMIAIAELEDTTLDECLDLAYNEIKDRGGILKANGNFVKDDDFFAKAMEIAEKSNCKKRKVGALAVDERGDIISIGYNYHDNGVCDCIEVKGSGTALHAEVVADVDRPKEGLILYVTHKPCENCEKLWEKSEIRYRNLSERKLK